MVDATGVHLSSFSTLYWTLGTLLIVEGVLVCAAATALWTQMRSQRRDTTRRERYRTWLNNLVDGTDRQEIESITDAHIPKGRRARETLRRVLHEQITESSGRRHRRLSRLYERLGYVERDRRLLGARSWQRRLEAMRRLFAVDDFYDRRLLLEGLEDHPRIRLLCAHLLVHRGEPDDAIAALNALRTSSNLMEQPVYAILERVDELRLGELVVHLDRIEPPRVRRAVMVTAAAAGLKGVDSTLETLETHDDERMRLAVCVAAAELPGQAGVQILLRRLEDPCWSVRAHAAKSLVACAGAEALTPLAAAVYDPSFWGGDHPVEPMPAVGASIQGNTVTLEQQPTLTAPDLAVFGDCLKAAVEWVPRLIDDPDRTALPASPRPVEVSL